MIQISYLGVLLAGIASMIVGYVWYSPILFSKPWIKLMGYAKENTQGTQSKMGKKYGVSFVVSLITAFILAHVMALSINFFHYSPIMTAITTAFSMWLGFIAPVQLTDVLFGKRAFQLFAITTGYQLVSLVVMGLVIAIL